MKILITNDDGIYSPGIAALARMAVAFLFKIQFSHGDVGHFSLNFHKKPERKQGKTTF